MSIEIGGLGTKRKGTPKKTTKVETQSKEVIGFSSRYPIYFIRILEILIKRKIAEQDYYIRPRYYASLGNYEDLKFEGYRREDLNNELATKISNSEVRSVDYRDLLEFMNEPTASYINRYEDEKGSQRYRITLLGESFLQLFEENILLEGYRNLIKKTQIPKTKGKISEIPKLLKHS